MALHQKQDKHQDWLKRQMQSILVDVNRIRNLATKNHLLPMKPVGGPGRVSLCFVLKTIFREDGSTKNFKFDSRPPQNASWRHSPSIEDSERSSSAATVVARVIDEEDDATSPTMAALHLDTASGPSAPPNSNVDPAPSSTPDGNE